jgi:hypothetical protein
MLHLLLLLPACEPEVPLPDSGSGPVDSGDSGGDSGDTAEDIVWTTLPANCDIPSPMGEDPITLTQSIPLGTMHALVELLDVELRDGRAYAVGQGGLRIVDASSEESTELGSTGDRFHRVEAIQAGYVATTHRDRGLSIVDVRDPARPTTVASFGKTGWEGMSYVDGLLYVSSRFGGVEVVDVSSPTSPASVGTSTGLSSPWELSDAHEGWIYAADQVLGVVPVDLASPRAPVVGTPVALDSAVLHVTVHDGWLYASAGGGGVVIFDLADPSSPREVARLKTGGSVVMTAVADGVLHVADHDALVAYDVSDPTAPVPIGWELVPEFALGVAVEDGEAWVADWTKLERWAVHPDRLSPEVVLSSSRVLFSGGEGTAELTVRNLGGAPLRLTGATSVEPRLSISASAEVLAPGESALLRLQLAPGPEVETRLCLATDDADGPLQTIEIGTGDHRYLGTPAPDFVLPGLDGQSYRLSEQLGHPVMLAYFATW